MARPTNLCLRRVLCASLALATLGAELFDDAGDVAALNESEVSREGSGSAVATLRELVFKRRPMVMRHHIASGEQGRAGTPPPPVHEKLFQDFGLFGLLVLLCCLGACCHWLEHRLHEHGHGHAQRSLGERKASNRDLAQASGAESGRSYESLPGQEINTIEGDGVTDENCLPACCTGTNRHWTAGKERYGNAADRAPRAKLDRLDSPRKSPRAKYGLSVASGFWKKRPSSPRVLQARGTQEE